MPDQIVARRNDDDRPPNVAEPMQNRRHLHGDGRLPGAGVTRERHVQRRGLGRKSDFFAQRVDQEQIGDLANPLFDGRETDQFGIEFAQNRTDFGAPVRLVEIERPFSWDDTAHRVADRSHTSGSSSGCFGRVPLAVRGESPVRTPAD